MGSLNVGLMMELENFINDYRTGHWNQRILGHDWKSVMELTIYSDAFWKAIYRGIDELDRINPWNRLYSAGQIFGEAINQSISQLGPSRIRTRERFPPMYWFKGDFKAAILNFIGMQAGMAYNRFADLTTMDHIHEFMSELYPNPADPLRPLMEQAYDAYMGTFDKHPNDEDELEFAPDVENLIADVQTQLENREFRRRREKQGERDPFGPKRSITKKKPYKMEALEDRPPPEKTRLQNIYDNEHQANQTRLMLGQIDRMPEKQWDPEYIQMLQEHEKFKKTYPTRLTHPRRN